MADALINNRGSHCGRAQAQHSTVLISPKRLISQQSAENKTAQLLHRTKGQKNRISPLGLYSPITNRSNSLHTSISVLDAFSANHDRRAGEETCRKSESGYPLTMANNTNIRITFTSTKNHYLIRIQPIRTRSTHQLYNDSFTSLGWCETCDLSELTETSVKHVIYIRNYPDT